MTPQLRGHFLPFHPHEDEIPSSDGKACITMQAGNFHVLYLPEMTSLTNLSLLGPGDALNVDLINDSTASLRSVTVGSDLFYVDPIDGRQHVGSSLSIINEATARATTDAALQSSIATLESLITAEVTRATNSENAISGSLTAEVSRAQGQEGVATTAIAVETTRAMAAESLIASNLASETARVNDIEATVQTLSTTSVASTNPLLAGIIRVGITPTNVDFVMIPYAFPTQSTTYAYGNSGVVYVFRDTSMAAADCASPTAVTVTYDINGGGGAVPTTPSVGWSVGNFFSNRTV